MNRITTAIDKMKTQIEGRIKAGLTTKAKVKETNKTLDMNIAEHARFQTLKSLAFASGKLNQDEAQTIFNLLGNTVSVFNKQPIHVKYVLTRLFGELISAS
jgi:hypothetical protein